MLTQEHNNKFKYITTFVSVILVLDIITIISNLYVSTSLDQFGLPDILIIIKALYFSILLIILVLWNTQKINIPKHVLKVLIGIAFTYVMVYFLSLYLYKYFLLYDTSYIIRYRILEGNPALALDYSVTNYKTLSYVVSIFGGANSELILLLQICALQFALNQVSHVELPTETEYEYDDFLFPKSLLISISLLTFFSFISINVFTFTYNIFSLIEVGIALSAFILTIPVLILTGQLQNRKSTHVTKALFLGNHIFILVSGIILSLLFAVLFGLNIYFIIMNIGTYRVGTALISLILALFILFKSKQIISLENK